MISSEDSDSPRPAVMRTYSGLSSEVPSGIASVVVDHSVQLASVVDHSVQLASVVDHSVQLASVVDHSV